VIKEAEKNLVELSNLPSTHKLLSESKDYFEKIMYDFINLGKTFITGKIMLKIMKKLLESN
jgi:hypothetical protein